MRVIALSVGTRSLAILVLLTPEANEEVAARIEGLVDSIEIDPS